MGRSRTRSTRNSQQGRTSGRTSPRVRTESSALPWSVLSRLHADGLPCHASGWADDSLARRLAERSPPLPRSAPSGLKAHRNIYIRTPANDAAIDSRLAVTANPPHTGRSRTRSTPLTQCPCQWRCNRFVDAAANDTAPDSRLAVTTNPPHTGRSRTRPTRNSRRSRADFADPSSDRRMVRPPAHHE